MEQLCQFPHLTFPMFPLKRTYSMEIIHTYWHLMHHWCLDLHMKRDFNFYVTVSIISIVAHFFQVISADNPMIKILDPEKIASTDHLMRYLTSTESLVFRKPGSKYMQHDSLFKITVLTKLVLIWCQTSEEVDAVALDSSMMKFMEYAMIW